MTDGTSLANYILTAIRCFSNCDTQLIMQLTAAVYSPTCQTQRVSAIGEQEIIRPSMIVSPSSAAWLASADTSCPFSLSWQVRVSVSVAISIATHREFGNIYCYTALDSLQTVVCAHATQPSIWDTARYDVLYANNLDN
jgi:hypothetical protein